MNAHIVKLFQTSHRAISLVFSHCKWLQNSNGKGPVNSGFE